MNFAPPMDVPFRFFTSNATVLEGGRGLADHSNARRTDVTPLLENPRLVRPLRTISELAQLQENWDSYGSPPIRPIARASAIHFLKVSDAASPPIPFVAPVPGGGIQLEWRTATRELEIEILPDGFLEYVMTDELGRECDGDLPPFDEEVTELIAWLMHRPSKYDQN